MESSITKNDIIAHTKIKDPEILNISKSICKIKSETILGFKYGTGFLLKHYIEQEKFYFLLTNKNEISNNLKNNKNIYLSYDNGLKTAIIKLNEEKRNIKYFTDIGLDLIVIEILKEDDMSDDCFIYLKSEEIVNKGLLDYNRIYIPQYIEEKELIVIEGKIKEIKKNELTYLIDLKNDSSGYPIILEKCYCIIGISKITNSDKKESYGELIYPINNIIEEDMRKKKNNGKFIDGKYIWDNGKYYIGEFENKLPNGKGIKYYVNGKIQYEGSFINGKFEGNGKYIYDDNYYFIGQYKNGLRNVKGISYYPDGKILFEGEYINDKREGYGKYNDEDGTYYIGQFRNGLFNGKGTEYYSNGKIQYEGDYVNGKFEGNGKYIWEDGEYYIGHWKNDLSNGKGILYYSNGKIKYEGDYVNGKREGYGKNITVEGNYYLGQWKNNLRNGKGILYYSNGKIKYEGDWINGLPNGYGKYIYQDGSYYIGQWKKYLRHGKGTMFNSKKEIENKGNWINDEFIGN